VKRDAEEVTGDSSKMKLEIRRPVLNFEVQDSGIARAGLSAGPLFFDWTVAEADLWVRLNGQSQAFAPYLNL
jgi:hypothetical protein